jgi:hypothetical protein
MSNDSSGNSPRGQARRPMHARLALPVGLMLSIAFTCSDAAAAGWPEYEHEITAFGGVTGGGSFEDTTTGEDRDLKSSATWGIVFNVAADANSQYDFLYSHQANSIKGSPDIDLDIEYLQLGGSLIWGDYSKYVFPYFSMTVGAARLSPDSPGMSATTRFAFSLAGGLRVPLSPRVGLRFEARTYGITTSSDGYIFCGSSGGATCLVRAHSSVLFQFGVTAGVSVGF